MSTDVATLTGAYAVDALTGSERARFERHLATCEDCAQEVREFRETVTRLGTTAGTAPPSDLKDRVLAEISRTRQEPPGSSGTRRGMFRGGSPWGTRLTAVAAVVGMALAATFGGFAWHSQRELAESRHRFEQVSESSMVMAQLLEAPDARVVTTNQNGMKATTVMSEQLHRVMFMSTGIEQPPTGHNYQLWFLGPFGATSAGLIRQDRAGRMDPLVAPVPQATTAMGVTLEPAGGSTEPTGDPMMTMSL